MLVKNVLGLSSIQKTGKVFRLLQKDWEGRSLHLVELLRGLVGSSRLR